MKTARTYTMRTRAAAAGATRVRILEATVALLKSRFRSEIRLEDVATGAQVTVQTIINLFGNRAALLHEAQASLVDGLKKHRLRAEPGDTQGAIAALVDQYEQFGDWVIRNLADDSEPALMEMGRARHRQWVERQFATKVAHVDVKRRRPIVDELVCVCDVYVWKLLRRDMDRSRSEVEKTILSMVTAIVKAV